MSYFDGIKAGDMVFVVGHGGWRKVTSVNSDSEYAIIIKDFCSFTMNGEWVIDGGQVAFWDDPKIVPPPRPKRKAEKEHLVYLNLDKNKFGKLFAWRYKTKEAAIRGVGQDTIVTAYEVRIPYEEEE